MTVMVEVDVRSPKVVLVHGVAPCSTAVLNSKIAGSQSSGDALGVSDLCCLWEEGGWFCDRLGLKARRWCRGRLPRWVMWFVFESWSYGGGG